MSIRELALSCKTAAAVTNTLKEEDRNRLLLRISDELRAEKDFILIENEKDIVAAKENGISKSLIDRLLLTEKRISDIADATVEVTRLSSGVGEILEEIHRPNGLKIMKKRVPMGLIGMIYEARPNVTVDAAVLCLKAGSSVLLRGGKEAIHSNKALCHVMKEALRKEGVSSDTIGLVEDTSRESAYEMMRLSGVLDLLIPRGGAGLIRSVVENSTVPIIETGTGNCHIYVEKSADLEAAVRIIDNAKTQRPSVCNAVETVLVDEEIAERFLPLCKETLDRSSVEIRGCTETVRILGDRVTPATETDYDTEFGDYILAIKVVTGLNEALSHITRYSTKHSDAILTENEEYAQIFTERVDSAAVYVNASTRFTDGGEFGFGAEIGISTQKLHARGPMGLKEITTYKYVILGNGQIR